MPDLDRLQALFADALARPPADRPAFLAAACGPDAGLRRQLDGLLAAHAAAGGFLSAPHPDATADLPRADATRTAPGDTTAYQPPPQDVAGAVVAGRYKLLEQIGEGGMGTVWMADQTEPVRRRVAVKLIRADRGGSKTILARFEAERQAIALMDHPHIAKLLDAGTTDAGQPYFVMDLVKGVPLTDYCDAHTLPVPDRLELFRQVCSAVQHAHQKGVIHRDLKPSNILVESHDGKAVPKVIDFGLAKATGGLPLTDHTLFTGFGSIAGTPLYMAPEQATFNAVDIDTRADVYALGVILYELLTGSTPIARETLKKAALEEVLRVVREQDPPSPSHRLSTADARPAIAAKRQTEPAKLGRMVRGELDWIVLKALAKDRDRRYETASGFARDVERFLNREPVSAGPPSAAYRARKFVQRNRGPVAAAGLVLLALVAGVAGTTLGLVEARRQRDAAEAARQAEQRERDLAQQQQARAEHERDEKEKARAAEADQRAVAQAKQAEAEAAQRAEAEQRRAAVAQRDAATATKEFLKAVLVQGDPGQATKDRAANPNRLLRQALDQAARDIEGRFDRQPAIEADLRDTIGLAYLGLGAYPAAERHLRAALGLRETALGGGDPDTLVSVNNLGMLYRAIGDYRRAEPLLVRALAGWEAARGPDHPGTLTSVQNLAGLYQQMGDHRRALPLYEQAVAGFERTRGPDHRDTLPSVGNLASLYYDMGDHRRALPLLVRALAGCEKVLGKDHPDTLTSAGNLGVLYQQMGDHRRAESLHRRALVGREKVLGPDHPDTLASVNDLGLLYRDKGEYGRAEPLLVQALAGRETVLGKHHPATLASVNNLATLYQDMGDLRRAEPLHRRALEGFEKAHGADHPLTLTSAGNLGRLLTETDRPAEAVPLLERVYAERTHPLHWVGAGIQLIKAYARVGRPADAARVVGEVLAEGRRRVKPASPEFGGMLAKSGNWLLDLDPAAAEPVLRECLELREKLDPKAWTTANTRSLLGDALLRQGKPAEAEPLLVAGYAGLLADRSNIPPPAANNLPEAADRLVDLYVALGKPDEAKRWRAERAKYPFVAPPPRPAHRP